MSERLFPLGSRVTLSDLAADPYSTLKPLREREPVSWIPEVAQWFVTRRADVLEVLRDREAFVTDSETSLQRDLFGMHMLSAEGALHSQYKRQCFPPFRTHAVNTTASG